MVDDTSKTSGDEELAPDDRLAWLRERGVVVETPEERKAVRNVTTKESTDAPVSYVLVPADTSKPLQELIFTPETNSSGDLLASYLKSAFSGTEGVDLSLFQEHTTKHLGSADAPQVSEETLQQVAAEGSVETFTLVHPIPSNKFTAIHVYLDEVGMLKRLSLNARASDYARRAGFEPPPQFYGDVFLARVQTQPRVKHLSFILGQDTDFNAEWIQRATTENLEYQLELNRITGRNDVQQGVDGGNGIAKVEEGYSWTQTEEEIEVVVPLPKGVVSKECSVKYRSRDLLVTCRKETLLSVRLFERIDPDGCTWTLDREADRQKLLITMEKVEQALWPRIRN